LVGVTGGPAAFSVFMLFVWWQEGHPACKKTEWCDAGMVICLGRGADLLMAQLMLLPLTISCFSKSRLVLPFWYWLIRIVLDKVKGSHKTVVVVVVVKEGPADCTRIDEVDKT